MPDSNFSKRLALLVALAGFMELFDGTVLQTAIPAMAQDFSVSSRTVSLAISLYFAAAAGAIPVCGWMADRYGAKASLAGSYLIFGASSLLCGVTSDLRVFMFARVIQGAAGAIMMTVGQIAILRTAPKEQMLKVTAYLVWPALAAPVVAPLIGGLVTDSIGWRWLFWFNLPLALTAVAAAMLVAPIKDMRVVPGRLDALTLALLSIGSCALVPGLGLTDLGTQPARIWLVSIGALFVIAGVARLRAVKNPLLDLKAFAASTFRASNTSGALYRAVISALPILLTLYLQTKFGFTATTAGLALMFLFAGNLSIKPLANYSVRRWGYPVTVFCSTVVGGVAITALAIVPVSVNLWMLAPMFFISGAARSVGFTAYMSMQYLEVPASQIPSATTLSGSVQNLATAIGVAVFMGILATSGDDYRFTLVTMAGGLLVSLIPNLRLPRDAGNIARH